MQWLLHASVALERANRRFDSEASEVLGNSGFGTRALQSRGPTRNTSAHAPNSGRDVFIMRNRKSLKRGFTLIEILIVVVILGILAAIVIPQFTNAADEAATSQAKSQLQSMRSQVQLFRAKNGYLPGDASPNDGVDTMASSTACFTELVTNSYIPAAPTLGGNYAWDVNGSGDNLIVLDATGGSDTGW